MLSSNLATFLKKNYSLDLRALALMRIGIGLIILFDLSVRITSLQAHYTDDGVLPLKSLAQLSGTSGLLSLHSLNGSWQFQFILFAVSFICGFFLLIGYRTQLFTFCCWVLIGSLQHRNPLIAQGGDDLLILVLFWGMFLPWGARYSVDTKRVIQPKENSWLALPGFGFILLIFSVYFFSALSKTSPEWRSEGTALYYALSLDQLVLPLGKWIYPCDSLLKALTHLTLYIELIAPILIILPVRNILFRSIAILSLVLLHVGISLTLLVGIFYMLGIVTAIGLLPTRMIDILFLKLSFLEKYRRVNTEAHKKKIRNKWNENFYIRQSINCIFLFVICFNLLWNISSIPGSGIGISEKFKSIGRNLRFEQRWNMFAPTVLKQDGWYILEGTTTNNLKIDIARDGKQVSYEKPGYLMELIGDDRWRKFGENYANATYAFVRSHYCNYLLTNWNKSHEQQQIRSLHVIYMSQYTEPGYKKTAPAKNNLCGCVIK